jgi:predicted alpha/beta hydrolase
MILVGQMTLSEPSIIIIWTYQDMMEWMSRILDGEMAGADEDFSSEVMQMWLNFVPSPNHKSTQHGSHGQYESLEPSIFIIWTYQDTMEWISRILDGEMAGADEDFASEVMQMWLNFVPSPNHKSTHQHDPRGQYDPFRTINYHHPDIPGHDGMDEQDIGWRNDRC